MEILKYCKIWEDSSILTPTLLSLKKYLEIYIKNASLLV